MSVLARFGWNSAADYCTYLDEKEKEIGAFLSRLSGTALSEALAPGRGATGAGPGEGLGPLAGMPFAVKDNIAVEGMAVSCGSKMLEGVVSPYSATAVERLMAAGAVVVGKTNMDEFGMGSSCDTSALGRTNNPWDISRVAGGSSGGSAAAVAAGMVPFALGSDTGGSVRQPAAFCGTYGLKPSYGTVSRRGLVAYASSLETIGVLAMDTELLRSVFDVIRGQDPLDQSSRPFPAAGARSAGKAEGRGRPVIGVIAGIEGLSQAQDAAYRAALSEIRKAGYEIVGIDLPMLEYVVPAYYTIASAEASANLARYAGIRYGHRTEWSEEHGELTEKSRDEAFGDEVKLRILMGTYVLRSGFKDQYYLRAQKIRTLLRREISDAFSRVDQILAPVYPVSAFPHGVAGLDPFQQKLADKFTATANLAAIPALAFPAGLSEGLPFGLQLMGPEFGEHALIDTASDFASIWKPSAAPGCREWR
jgi:aspartyl-tRNA(Asn)/glutamyl-tRNA(Gln) amidotransferase subunit A